MPRLLLVLIGAGLAAVGCGDDGAAPTVAGTAPVETATPILDGSHPYALLQDPAWTQIEAVDYAADSPLATVATMVVPPIDWFVEYAGDPIDRGDGATQVDNLTVTALDAPIDETVAAMADLGYPTEAVAAGPWSAHGASEPVDPEFDTIVLIDGGTRTVMVESPDLDTAALLEIAAALEPVDETAWVTSGGIIQ